MSLPTGDEPECRAVRQEFEKLLTQLISAASDGGDVRDLALKLWDLGRDYEGPYASYTFE